MNNETKNTLIAKISKLRSYEYTCGFASGVQFHKGAIEEAKKANRIFYEIYDLINLLNLKQNNG
jgi:lipid-binding SYLF domain-containing protein